MNDSNQNPKQKKTSVELHRVNMEQYQQSPERYELRLGSEPGAPSCPYGNRLQYIGYDLENQEYIRFTKSVFKKLVNEV